MTQQRTRGRRLALVLLAALSMASWQAGFSVPAAGATVIGPSPLRMWDPDSIAFPLFGSDGYVTYASTVRGTDSCGNVTWNTIRVPVTFHVGTSFPNCYNGDAMPAGAGAGFRADSDIWAPGIISYGGRYILYYSAQKPSGQWCLGKAESVNPLGPFTGQSEVACPGGGRWAIDPDPYVYNGVLYMSYRDDGISFGNQSGISTVQMASNGFAIWSTRRSMLLSSDVTWAYSTRTGVNVVENPTLTVQGGRFYLFFSGNDWQSRLYATGIADCGPVLLSGGRCTPLVDRNRPYFAYNGPGGHSNPVATISPNLAGPGGMAIFKANNGTAKVVYHHFNTGNNLRYALMGQLAFISPSFSIK